MTAPIEQEEHMQKFGKNRFNGVALYLDTHRYKQTHTITDVDDISVAKSW